LAPTKKILAADMGAKPGGTFADVNEAFALNSTDRQNTGSRARPGEGDLNFIQDIWGLPDFEGQKWVPAGGLADLSDVGSDLAPGNILLETRLLSVKEVTREIQRDTKSISGWPARYQIGLEDVRTGKTMKVYAEKVVVATGIGKPVNPIKEPNTVKFFSD